VERDGQLLQPVITLESTRGPRIYKEESWIHKVKREILKILLIIQNKHEDQEDVESHL
jgi:hypothetical protein